MEDLRNTVEEINDKLFMSANWEDDVHYVPFLEFISTPIGDRIDFAGFCIWDSENDGRMYFDEEDEYELMQRYLEREVGKVISSLKVMQSVLGGKC